MLHSDKTVLMGVVRDGIEITCDVNPTECVKVTCRTLEEVWKALDDMAKRLGVPPEELRLLNSSTMSFPEEETHDISIIELCRTLCGSH